MRYGSENGLPVVGVDQRRTLVTLWKQKTMMDEDVDLQEEVGSAEERAAKTVSCEISESSQECRRTFRMCSKKNGNRSFKMLSKDGIISCQSFNKCRKGRNCCRAYRTKRSSSARRIWDNGLETVSRSGMISKEGMPNLKNWVNKSRQLESWRCKARQLCI